MHPKHERMVTPGLRRALNYPPATHPLFRRTVILPVRASAHYLSWANFVISIVIGLSRYAPTLLFLMMPLILLVLGLTYGLDCALRVGNAIGREHEQNTYPLLALAPPGPLAAMWTLCTSALYRNHDFMRLRGIVQTSLISGLVGSLVIVAVLLIMNSELFTLYVQPASLTLANLVNFLMILGAVYAEYIQSLVLGVLVGLLVSTLTRTRLDISLWAFGIYLFLQMLVYLLTLLLGFTLLPLLVERLNISGDYTLAGLSLLRLVIFCAAREIVIITLWRSLLERLNVTPQELDFMVR